MKYGSALALLCCLTSQAYAESAAIKAATVREWCKGIEEAVMGDDGKLVVNRDKYPASDLCNGIFLTLQQATTPPASLINSCPPAKTALVEFVKVYAQYVDAHPDDANRRFIDIAIPAFTTAWPCKN